MAITIIWQQTGMDDFVVTVPADVESALESRRLSRLAWRERELTGDEIIQGPNGPITTTTERVPQFETVRDMLISCVADNEISPALATFGTGDLKALQDAAVQAQADADAAAAALLASMLPTGAATLLSTLSSKLKP